MEGADVDVECMDLILHWFLGGDVMLQGKLSCQDI